LLRRECCHSIVVKRSGHHSGGIPVHWGMARMLLVVGIPTSLHLGHHNWIRKLASAIE
jgi:hypothetical protein